MLLERIAAEKRRLVEAGEIRKPKKLPPIGPDEVPFEVPEGWAWVHIGEITSKIGSGSTPRGGKRAYISEGIKFLRSQNVWNDGLRLDDVAHIPQKVHARMSGTAVKSGDVLLNITGASIGRSALVPDDFDEGNVSQHVSIVRLVEKAHRGFLHISLVAPFFQDFIFRVQVGISREGLSKARLSELVVPLPPLPEQRRIVAKVDRLMALCDELEANLTRARTKSENLAASVVHHLSAA